MWIPIWVIIITVLIFTPLGTMILDLLLKPILLIGDFLGIFKEKTTPPNSQPEENEDEDNYSNSTRSNQRPQFKDEA
jgi:hypothetical protein